MGRPTIRALVITLEIVPGSAAERVLADVEAIVGDQLAARLALTLAHDIKEDGITGVLVAGIEVQHG